MARRSKSNSGRKRPPVRGRRKSKPVRRRWLARLVLFLTTLAIGWAAVYVGWSFIYDLDQVGQMPQRTTIYDRHGEFYARLHGENRISVSLDEVSPDFINALLAREDTRFYQHDGIDHWAILRAMLRNISSASIREGGSTITQQLARNSFPLGGQTLHRKILEALVAMRLEQQYSKDEILEFYINRIYFGSGIYGLETASRTYFGVPSRDLTLGQAALLAGIIRGPNLFSPFQNPEGAERQRDQVLQRMVRIRMISEEAADHARQAPLRLAASRRLSPQHDYAMDAVRRELDVILSKKQIDEGGLRVYTSLDPSLQEAAQNALSRRLDQFEATTGNTHPVRSAFSAEQRSREEAPDYLQGAAMVLENRTGGILALVGGRDYADSKFNRAVSMRRQVGSVFKPFVYSAAFERGLLPGTLVSDARLGPGEISAAPVAWNPANADGEYGHLLPAHQGLSRSRNTMSVRVGNRAGMERVLDLANRTGLGQGIPPYPASYLGAFEASLQETAAAFMVFPNRGVRRQVYLIDRIIDDYGRTVYKTPGIELPVLDSGVAWLTTRVLTEVVRSGTASRAKALGLSRPAAGKTGTTNDFHDAWFAGFTSSLTCAVWVGFDQPRRIHSAGYGSALALPIWVDIVESPPARSYPAETLPGGIALTRVRLCAASGLRAVQGCRQAGLAYDDDLPAGRVPQESCTAHSGRSLQAQDAPFHERAARSVRDLFRR